MVRMWNRMQDRAGTSPLLPSDLGSVERANQSVKEAVCRVLLSRNE
jgi:hypothetical protein